MHARNGLKIAAHNTGKAAAPLSDTLKMR